MLIYGFGDATGRRYLRGGAQSVVPRTQAMLNMRCNLRLSAARSVLEQCLYKSRQFRQQHSLDDLDWDSCD